MTTHNWELGNGNRVVFSEQDNITFTATAYYADNTPIKGGDRRILKSARVSNSPENFGMRLDQPEKDKGLISYLWKNKHQSPFEQVHLCFTVVCDLRTAMQMDTHRTMTKNRYSRRYSHDWVEFIQPQWRIQNTEKGTNKQGGDQLANQMQIDAWNANWKQHTEHAVKRYHLAIADGMAREQAAWFLPTGVLTSTFYTVSLRHIIDFIWTRCESHAQREIRDIAYTLKNELIPLSNPWTSELLDKEFELKGWVQKL